MRLLSIIAILSLSPSSALAEEELVSMSIFEIECRKEMNLVGVSLQPGKIKGDFRRCIRLKSSQSRTRTEAKRRRATSQVQEQEIQKKVSERQQDAYGGTSRYSFDKRMQYNLDCREMLGIGATDVVKPGPVLGTLKRCIQRKTSEASRAANIRRRRSSVQQRANTIGTTVKDQKESDLQTELKRLNTQQRTRLKTQVKANPRVLKTIRESFRVRSFFTNPRVDTSAAKKRDVQSCRRVPASEWSTCIREALSN